MRTDFLGIDETAQPFSATAVLPFPALVFGRGAHLAEGKTRRRYEYPIFLRSDQPLRGVADGIDDAFFLDVALAAGYSRGRTALHANGGLFINCASIVRGLNGLRHASSSLRRRRIECFTTLTNANVKLKEQENEKKGNTRVTKEELRKLINS